MADWLVMIAGRRPIGGANLGMEDCCVHVCGLRMDYTSRALVCPILQSSTAIMPSSSIQAGWLCLDVLMKSLWLLCLRKRLLCLGMLLKDLCLCLGEAGASPFGLG